MDTRAKTIQSTKQEGTRRSSEESVGAYCGKGDRTAFHCEKRKSDEKREKTEEKVIFAFGKQSSNIEDYIMSRDSEGIEIGL